MTKLVTDQIAIGHSHTLSWLETGYGLSSRETNPSKFGKKGKKGWVVGSQLLGLRKYTVSVSAPVPVSVRLVVATTELGKIGFKNLDKAMKYKSKTHMNVLLGGFSNSNVDYSNMSEFIKEVNIKLSRNSTNVEFSKIENGRLSDQNKLDSATNSWEVVSRADCKL